MTFKFDSYKIGDTATKLIEFPDHVWVDLTSVSDNTAGIFIADSQANVQAGTKRARLPPGVSRAFKANSDDELWVMATDGSEPELVVTCADDIGPSTGGVFETGIVVPLPQAAGSWGKASSPHVNSLQTTGITVNANWTYFCAVANEDDRDTSGVSGMGLTWVKDKGSHNTGDARATLWRGTGTPSGTGEVTATFTGPGSTSSSAMMVFAFTNIASATPFINAKTQQGSGTSVNVSTAQATELDGLHLEVVAEDNNRTYTPTSGSVKFPSQGVGSDIAIHVAYFVPTTAGSRSVSASLSGSADWAAISAAYRKG